jgi:hypothetical protein
MDESGGVAPYHIELDDGQKIQAPIDHDDCIKKA